MGNVLVVLPVAAVGFNCLHAVLGRLRGPQRIAARDRRFAAIYKLIMMVPMVLAGISGFVSMFAVPLALQRSVGWSIIWSVVAGMMVVAILVMVQFQCMRWGIGSRDWSPELYPRPAATAGQSGGAVGGATKPRMKMTPLDFLRQNETDQQRESRLKREADFRKYILRELANSPKPALDAAIDRIVDERDYRELRERKAPAAPQWGWTAAALAAGVVVGTML